MLTASDRAHFREHGFLRLAGAFPRRDADAMQDLVWGELARVHRIDRVDRTSWRLEHVPGLQRISGARVFAAIGGPPLRAAIDDLLGPTAWQTPKRWGTILVTFPAKAREWTIPSAVWHADFSWALPPEPLPGVKVFALVSDVLPRGGGTLVVAGSHRVAESFVREQSAGALANTRRTRLALLASHPWLRDLSSPAAPRLPRRFLDEEARIGDVPVRVVELTGAAGDVVITHPWLLHCRAPNCGSAPRFMRRQDVYRASLAPNLVAARSVEHRVAGS